MTAEDGLVIVDKPAGLTSHDVVARVRRLAGTRRVGHAGTLDPMATGVLVIGVGRATRMLGHLPLDEKAYTATIRLGVSTVTDDAEGEVLARHDAAGLGRAGIVAEAAALTGDILQSPSAVSAVKVAGRRSYARVRAGEPVALPPRPVSVHRLDVDEIRRHARTVDVDVSVVCSAGTYVRALARDLGAALGVGGHLTALRRTRVGPFDLSAAATLEQLAEDFGVVSLDEVAAATLPRLDVDAATAAAVRHGVPLPRTGLGPGPVAVFDPRQRLLALVEDRGPRARYLLVLPG